VPFGVWLMRIAAHAVADQWKRNARESANNPPEAAVGADFDGALERARLFRLVDGLPRDQRQVIQMRFSEGRSVHEIGDALKKSDGAIKQLQFRALQTLRARMTEHKSGTRHG
jgi:RNA polymerase sigma-70 factor (ECF subfamily)